MTRLGASKLILSFALVLLAQCHETEAGPMANIMQSILDVLKNIEKLLKDDSITINHKSKNDLENTSTLTPKARISIRHGSIDANVNNDTDTKVEDNTENTENKTETINGGEPISRRSLRRNISKNLNKISLHKRPKMAAKTETDDSADHTRGDNGNETDNQSGNGDDDENGHGNEEEDENEEENENEDENENMNDNQNVNYNQNVNNNGRVAARLFEESDEMNM